MSLTRDHIALWCGRMEGWLEGQPLIPKPMAAAMRDEINELRDMALRSLDREGWVSVPRDQLVLWHRVMLRSDFGQYEEACISEMEGALAAAPGDTK